jgi:hypothetical protein
MRLAVVGVVEDCQAFVLLRLFLRLCVQHVGPKLTARPCTLWPFILSYYARQNILAVSLGRSISVTLPYR